MRKIDKHIDDKKESDSPLGDIKTDALAYISKQLEIIKLKSYEKTSVFSSFLVFWGIVFTIVFSLYLLVLLTLGYFFGELLNSYAAGFGILILFSILVLILLIANGKKIRRAITNFVVSIIKKVESDEE